MEKKLNQLGATIAEEAYHEFFERMDYLNNDSISLLHMLKELEKLSFHAKTISPEHVKALTPDYRQGNVFLFESIIQNRDADELNRQLSVLSADAQFGLLFLLLRSYLIAYKEKMGYSKKEIGCTVIRLHDFSIEELEGYNTKRANFPLCSRL